MKDIAKHNALLGEELQCMQQIQTCEDIVFTILNLVRQHGRSIHLLTVEEIIQMIHQMELDYRTELLHVNLEQAIEASNQHS